MLFGYVFFFFYKCEVERSVHFRNNSQKYLYSVWSLKWTILSDSYFVSIYIDLTQMVYFQDLIFQLTITLPGTSTLSTRYCKNL